MRSSKFKKYIEFRNETVFKDYEGIVIGKCIRCGILKTIVTKLNGDFNPKQSRSDFYEENKEMFVKLFNPIVKKIKQFKKKGRVLDVGCSSGILLELFKREGYDSYGIEPNKEAYKVVSKKIRKKIFNGVLRDFLSKNKMKFDIVVYNHVLEHVDNPIEELRLIKKALKKEGIIVFGLPNTQNIIFFLRNKYWESLMPNEHVWHFSKSYFVKLLSKLNFTILNISFSDDERKDYTIVKRLYFYLLSLINRFLRTGEAMLLIAKN